MKHFIANKVYYWDWDVPYVYVTIKWDGQSYKDGEPARKISINVKKRINLTHNKYESVLRTDKASPYYLYRHINIPGFRKSGSRSFVNENTGETATVPFEELIVTWETPPVQKMLFLYADDKCIVEEKGRVCRPSYIKNNMRRYYMGEKEKATITAPTGKFALDLSLPTGMRKIKDQSSTRVEGL